jgi:RecA/RadA recombinase
MSDVEQVKEALLAKTPDEPPIKPKDLLGTGSTLLNLACSGQTVGGLPVGKYIWFVGDSQSGKTWLALSAFAEATLRPKRFANYRLIHDNAEDGALMDLGRYFGAGVAERIEAPRYDKDGNPLFSTSIDEFYFNLDDALAHEQPCIYIMDSMDALTSEEERAKFEERKKANRNPKAKEKVSGSFAMEKAKRNSSYIRQMLDRLKKSGSIVIIISQTRDNVQPGSFEKNTHAGGRAIKFYATLEMWTKRTTPIKRTVNGKERKIGWWVKASIRKNRITGVDSDVLIPIYYSHGVDDTGGLVEFLVGEKHWKTTDENKIVHAPEFEFKGSREKLIQHIEAEDGEQELRALAKEVWQDIIDKCAVQRKPRYGQ